MSSKNKYAHRAKISEKDFRKLLTLFALDLDATAISTSIGFSRNTVNAYLRRIRLRIAEHCLSFSPMRQDLEFGESFFQVYRVRRGNGQKTDDPIVMIGIIRQDGSVFVEIMPEFEKICLCILLKGRMDIEGATNDGYMKCFSGRIDVDGSPPVHPMQRKLRRELSPVEVLHDFCLFTRDRLMKFRGLKTESIRLHLKECEFRFNSNKLNLYPLLMRILRSTPLE